MPFTVPNTTSTNASRAWGNGLYVGGWIQVIQQTGTSGTAGIDVRLDHKPGGGQSPVEQGETIQLVPGYYPIIGDPRDPITTLNVKAHTTGDFCQYSALLVEDGKAGIGSGTPITATISAAGTVSPGAGLITGVIPAAGTTPTAGTGFTYTHVNGSGVYVFTFTTSFAAQPVVVANTLADNTVIAGVYNVSASGFTVHTATTAGPFGTTDEPFNFLASVVS